MDIRPQFFPLSQEENIQPQREKIEQDKLKQIEDIKKLHDSLFLKSRQKDEPIDTQTHSFEQMPTIPSSLNNSGTFDIKKHLELLRNKRLEQERFNVGNYFRPVQPVQPVRPVQPIQPVQSVQPIQVRMSLMNSSGSSNLIDLIKQFYKTVGGLIESVEPIDINILKSFYDDFIVNIEKYNGSINSWYDSKFYDDKAKFYSSLESEDKKFISYESTDYIKIDVYE